VRNIGAVEPLTLLDEGLRPDHLFRGAESHWQIEDLVGGRMREPLVIDSGDAIARAIDHIDEILAAVRFAEPVWERYLGLIAGLVQGS